MNLSGHTHTDTLHNTKMMKAWKHQLFRQRGNHSVKDPPNGTHFFLSIPCSCPPIRGNWCKLMASRLQLRAGPLVSQGWPSSPLPHPWLPWLQVLMPGHCVCAPRAQCFKRKKRSTPQEMTAFIDLCSLLVCDASMPVRSWKQQWICLSLHTQAGSTYEKPPTHKW